MCEKITLTFFDWDRGTDDDPIGTAVIDLKEISGQGVNGYLPIFGPSFINLYGSPREYSDLPDKYDALNLGRGEGVAYRGRVLVELETELLEEPTQDSVAPLEPDLVSIIQKMQRRRKFRLYAAFLSASLIATVDTATVEFEVTVGNQGNKLDTSVSPCASSTPPTYTVYDGEAYSYLPWGNNKPCVVIDSQWEDISFRLCTLNQLLKISDRLTRNIEKVKIGAAAHLMPEEQAQLAIASLDEFIMDCSQPLPTWEPENSPETDLDKHLRMRRETELQSLRTQAISTRETVTSIDDAITQLENYRSNINNLAIEPQNSFPDIVLWMLMDGKRAAYFRIPANEILFRKESDQRGRFCGVTQTINLKKPRLKSEDESNHWKIPAQLRMILWLGLEGDAYHWDSVHSDATVNIFAETYENQASLLGNWVTSRPPLSRPSWSDYAGRIELPKDCFTISDGWQWSGDWFVSPEASLTLAQVSGQNHFIEELFYNETRSGTSAWAPANPTYTTSDGEARDAPTELNPPEGWKWDGDWEIDYNRPCDNAGFEYSINAAVGGYTAVEKRFHMYRRRRLTRKRSKVEADTTTAKPTQVQKNKPDDQWEYAFNFDSKFHCREGRVDMVRRRRWHRRILPVKGDMNNITCVALTQAKSSESKENLVIPRIYLSYKSPHLWHLRAYLFQARGLYGADDSGLSDPYVRCSFQGLTKRTETLNATLSPKWDQTLIFEQIEMYGDPAAIAACPPPVVIEIYDWNKINKDQYLGRCQIAPFIKINPTDSFSSMLQWYRLERGSQQAGEILAAFELILVDSKPPPLPPTRRGDIFNVPEGIRPALQRTGIEIMCWGVRNMCRHQLSRVNSPSVQFEIGGQSVESSIIKDLKQSPNFPQPLLFLDVLLPKEELYLPPMNICVRDHRAFGLKPLVGMHVLKNFGKYKVAPRKNRMEPLCNIPVLCDPNLVTRKHTSVTAVAQLPMSSSRTSLRKTKEHNAKDDFDWWSKFYASIGEWDKCLNYKSANNDTLMVYNCPLEKVSPYDGFNDFCETFTLTKGKEEEDEEDNVAGEFKGTFRIYPLPEDPEEAMPIRYFEKLFVSPAVEECTVRVYVVRATDLQPADTSGLADPYVEVRLGNKKMSSKDKYIPNTLNPTFGCMFELKCQLPNEKDLQVRIKDYDVLGTDDIIGETHIDLENRRLTKYRATCGIPQTYCTSGLNQWRDSLPPSEILVDVCDFYGLPRPQYAGVNEADPQITCRVGEKNFALPEFERGFPATSSHAGPPKERLALHILNELPLVKEHVETRPLFSTLQPNIEQGKLQMWVDIFPSEFGTPGPAVDISPRKPLEYELRVVVWNTVDTLLQETSITGEKMSDIYVKGWLSGIEELQKTDVHYRSLDGDGNFNWRFVFPFNYLPAENMIVSKRKAHFWSLDTTTTQTRPNLVLQVWDNDLFSADDFLGTLEIDLVSIPPPSKTAEKCGLEILRPTTKRSSDTINLFESRRTRGFWPFIRNENGIDLLAGKGELELELLTHEEAALKPAGRGREDPNENPYLEPPKRPETSFFWLTSPWKTFKFIIWKRCKWVILGILLAVIFGLLIALFIYAMPHLLARKLVGV
ncbi:unnamed protein product [Calicophoron daubneyi]